MLNPNVIQNREFKTKIALLGSVFLSVTLISCGSQKPNTITCQTKLEDFAQVTKVDDGLGSQRATLILAEPLFMDEINRLVSIATKTPSELPENSFVHLDNITKKPVIEVNNIYRLFGKPEDKTCKPSTLFGKKLAEEQEKYGFGPKPQTTKPQTTIPKTENGF